MDFDRLTTILRQRLTGEVCVNDESLAAVSRDFGGVAEGRPRVVVWPENTDDVVAIIRTAREAGTSLSVRGAGHSQGGQALNRGGLVIQTQRLHRIEAFSENEGWITAQAGMLWSDLVDSVIEHDLLPPVMTDNLQVTLGGTLAVGGVGPASFRHGAQIDHCLGLEVVLGTGERIWLSAEHQPGLFHSVLGGLGQFGVVTKFRLRLRPAPRLIRRHYLTYENVKTFVADAQQLMAREAVNLLSGFGVPKENQVAGSIGHTFVLAVCTEMDQMPLRDMRQIVEGLSPVARSEELMTTRDYLARLKAALEVYQRPTEKEFAHPWVEHFLPISAVAEYVDVVSRKFPTDLLLLWPMRTASFQRPTFRLPMVDDMALVGILCSCRHPDLAEVLSRLRTVDELGIALGGKRYLSGWIDFDTDRWCQHYGVERWKEITAIQRQCDPDYLFRSWERSME